MSRLRQLPDDAPLTPGKYVLEVTVESQLRGEALRDQFTAAFHDVLREATADPNVWLEFIPRKVEIDESSDPANPDIHTGRLWFEVNQPPGVTPTAGPLVVVGWLVALAAGAFAAYHVFRVISIVMHALEDTIPWVIYVLGGAVAAWLIWALFRPTERRVMVEEKP